MPLDYRAGKPGVYRIYGVRKQRRESTDAEQKLWNILRNRQLNGAKFRRQHQFGPYTLDFYCPDSRLAIEADGSQHYEPEGPEHDQLRTSYLSAYGVRVLRFNDNEILTNIEGVASRILKTVEDGQPSPEARITRPGLSQGERQLHESQSTREPRRFSE